MDSQELMQLLRKDIRAYQAKMDADGKPDREEMLKKMRAWGEKLDEGTRATLAETRAIEARTAAMRDKRLKANMNAWQEETTACQDAMEAHPEEEEQVSVDTKPAAARQEKVPIVIPVVEPEEETTNTRKETMACHEMEARLEEKEPTSADRNPEAAEQREVPAENATVMPVGEPKKKRRMDRKLAAERRRQEPKHTKRINGRPQEKLASACWNVSRRVTVAWRKRNIFKENLTQRNCSLPKLVTAARKITRSARHRCKGRNKEDVTPRYPKRGTRRAKMARKTSIDRKMSRRATVARRKRDIVKSYLPQEKCHPRRELVTSRTRTTHRAGVARQMENIIGEVRARDNVVRGTLKDGLPDGDN
jgi:hypothetical protein